MITHNMRNAIQYGNHLIMMDAGRIVSGRARGGRKNLLRAGSAGESSTWKTTGCCSRIRVATGTRAEEFCGVLFSALRKGTAKHCLWTGDKWRVLGAYVKITGSKAFLAVSVLETTWEKCWAGLGAQGFAQKKVLSLVLCVAIFAVCHGHGHWGGFLHGSG